MGLGETERAMVEVTVTRSAGIDGAIVVYIDTDFEPDGSDGGSGLRVLINDFDAYAPIAFEMHAEQKERPAYAKKLSVEAGDIAYQEEKED